MGAQVAVGAVRECGELLRVEWRLCGLPMASALVPVFLNMPSPVDVVVSASQSRLSPPSDDATAAPISVKTQATLSVLVSFDDGSSKDMSSDSRVSVVVGDAAVLRL